MPSATFQLPRDTPKFKEFTIPLIKDNAELLTLLYTLAFEYQRNKDNIRLKNTLALLIFNLKPKVGDKCKKMLIECNENDTKKMDEIGSVLDLFVYSGLLLLS